MEWTGFVDWIGLVGIELDSKLFGLNLEKGCVLWPPELLSLLANLASGHLPFKRSSSLQSSVWHRWRGTERH